MLQAEIKALRGKVHAMLATMWRAKMKRDKCNEAHARYEAYFWLSRKMKSGLVVMPIVDYTPEQLQQAITIMSKYVREKTPQGTLL